ncbi:Holliday junction resolvase RuvX [candidate division CSSED10-310 bacterium]|uniref:Putative pre-16S rRNA nuclease n=1 Tax=candidate division CSSED10-310 bacterium TaxID=2855610 RepID=A0ABV6YZ43_UNCC1
MKILALDYGEKSIGVAVSDPLLITAQGRQTIIRKNLSRDITVLQQLIEVENITKIILGLPLNMDGSHSPMSREVQQFATVLEEKLKLPVIFWDERLTSALAEKALLEGNCRRARRKKEIDRLAAVLILQNYLDASTSSTTE